MENTSPLEEETPQTQEQDEQYGRATAYGLFNDTAVSPINPYESSTDQIKTLDKQNVSIPPADLSSIYPDSNATPNFLSMLDTKIGKSTEVLETSLADHQSFKLLAQDDPFLNDQSILALNFNEPKQDEPELSQSLIEVNRPKTKIRVNNRTKQKSTFDVNHDLTDHVAY